MKMNPKLKKAIEIKLAREIYEGQDRILNNWFYQINKMKVKGRLGIAWKVIRGTLQGKKLEKPHESKIILPEDFQ